MTDIIRTWFYNRDILAWYKEFNEVRTSIYRDQGIFNHILPASTGIDGRPPCESALTASVIAIKPKSSQIVIKEVDSPFRTRPQSMVVLSAGLLKSGCPDSTRLVFQGLPV